MSSLPYIVGFIFGILSGFYYFYGLLLTVRRVPVSPNPKRLLALSFLVRICPVLMIMIVIARRNPGMFIALLVGFFIARFIMTRKVNRLEKVEIHASQP